MRRIFASLVVALVALALSTGGAGHATFDNNNTAAGRAPVVQQAFAGHINWSTKRIWPFGDSITWGTGDGPAQDIGCGYRDRLNQLMLGNGLRPIWVGSQINAFNFVIGCPNDGGALRALPNDGHSGWFCVNTGTPTISMNAQFSTLLAATGQVDAILLHAGTNDLISDNANAIANCNTLYTTITTTLGKGVYYFFAQLVPSNIPGTVTTVAFNANVASEVATLQAAGYKAYLVDMYDALIPAPSADFAGTVHPSLNGYPKMAATWYAALTAAQ